MRSGDLLACVALLRAAVCCRTSGIGKPTGEQMPPFSHGFGSHGWPGSSSHWSPANPNMPLACLRSE